MRRLAKQFINLALITASSACYSGAQKHEPLSTSVQATLHRAIADEAAPVVAFTDRQEARHWLNTMSGRLTKKSLIAYLAMSFYSQYTMKPSVPD
jgi:hypothetical protein